jgi:hypothetical protein
MIENFSSGIKNGGGNCFRTSRLWSGSGLRASKGIRKSPRAFVGTFRKFLLITTSRRLEVKDRLNVNFNQFFLKAWRIY